MDHETEARQRNVAGSSSQEDQKTDGLDIDQNAGASLPQASDKTTPALDTALESLPPRWRNWIIRGIFTWIMILGFAFIIWLGPLAIILLVIALEVKCFQEIITIGYSVYRSYDLPWFRTLSWYFLITSNYYFYGENMIHYFGVLLSKTEFAQPFVTYHRFISFSMYVCGFIAFVMSLVKTHYLKQFTLFGWTHVTLLLVVTSTTLEVQNIFEGLIWCILPHCLIITNDIWAYMFGFFFGSTPLIKLSPKKTWEGFIGGAFATLVFGFIICYFLLQFDYFVCPLDYSEELDQLHMTCERSAVFKLQEYNLPATLQTIFRLVNIPWKTVKVYPMLFHTVFLSLFASIIGPFGGFFASGFKRAFKIKDFGDIIPGHGGIMDRFDCQFLMAVFVNVYHVSFIRAANPQKLLRQILSLKVEDQLELFVRLNATLAGRGLLKQ